MTEMKDVLQAILTDLVEARHQANQYSLSLSESYKGEGGLSDFQIPVVDIGAVKMDLKFVMDAAAGGGSANVILTKKQRDSVVAPLAEGVLSMEGLIFTDESTAPTIQKKLRAELASVIEKNIEPKKLRVNKSAVKELVGLLTPHLKRNANGQLISQKKMSVVLGETMTKVEAGLLQKQGSLNDSADGEKAKRPSIIIDSEVLSKTPEHSIHTLSLDLDLNTLEWTNSAA